MAQAELGLPFPTDALVGAFRADASADGTCAWSCAWWFASASGGPGLLQVLCVARTFGVRRGQIRVAGPAAGPGSEFKFTLHPLIPVSYQRPTPVESELT